MRRKRFALFIYPQFQYKLVTISFSILIGAFSSVSWQIYSSFTELKNMGKMAGLPPHHNFFKFLDFQEQNIYTSLGWVLLASSLLSLCFLLYNSHKIAGPIVRLKKSLKDIAEGKKVEQLQFRNDDYFNDIPELFNDAFKKNIDARKVA